jgi:SAM-dependent methyltransferase
MAAIAENADRLWRCLHCRSPLTVQADALLCNRCQKQYPLVGGIAVMVSEPGDYLRSQLGAVERDLREAVRRSASLDMLAQAGVPHASIERHRDVLAAETARAEAFRDLMAPAAGFVSGNAAGPAHASGVRRSGFSGWALEALLPFLLRDWMETPERDFERSLIATALEKVLPQRKGKSIAFAGCGAGGLLARMPSAFDQVFGFDLSFPMLAAARRLLDGHDLELALPRSVANSGSVLLKGCVAPSPVSLLAMDALDTAFADGVLDCVITCFVLDLMADPRLLAREVHRILSPSGVWINYGPSGPAKALWRFDTEESAAFFTANGFEVVETEMHRTTHLDLSRHFPAWNFRNQVCYLTISQKGERRPQKPQAALPSAQAVAAIIPRHFPAAQLIERESLNGHRDLTIILRHERIPGLSQACEISADMRRLIRPVDGVKTVGEIAALLREQFPDLSIEDTLRAYQTCFQEGILDWKA